MIRYLVDVARRNLWLGSQGRGGGRGAQTGFKEGGDALLGSRKGGVGVSCTLAVTATAGQESVPW